MQLKLHLEHLDEESRRIFQIAYPDYDDSKYEAISWSQEQEMTAYRRLSFIPKHIEEIKEEMIRLKKEYEAENSRRIKNGDGIYYTHIDETVALDAIAIVEERERRKEQEER